jgi:hypothetical protein
MDCTQVSDKVKCSHITVSVFASIVRLQPQLRHIEIIIAIRRTIATLSLGGVLYRCYCSIAAMLNMKINTIICVLTLGTSLLMTGEAIGQEPTKMTRAEHQRLDSLMVTFKNDQADDQKTKDAKSISDMKTKKNDAKAKAKEAKRVKAEADDAAKQSRKALSAERKAQHARKQADAQLIKADKSRVKSYEN